MVVKSVDDDDDDEDDDDDDEDDSYFVVVVVEEEVFFVFFQNDPSSSFSFDKDFGTHWNATTTPNETTTITFTRRGACDQHKRRLC